METKHSDLKTVDVMVKEVLSEGEDAVKYFSGDE